MFYVLIGEMVPTCVVVQSVSYGLGVNDEEVDVTSGRGFSELVPEVRAVPQRVNVTSVNLPQAHVCTCTRVSRHTSVSNSCYVDVLRYYDGG